MNPTDTNAAAQKIQNFARRRQAIEDVERKKKEANLSLMESKSEPQEGKVETLQMSEESHHKNIAEFDLGHSVGIDEGCQTDMWNTPPSYCSNPAKRKHFSVPRKLELLPKKGEDSSAPPFTNSGTLEVALQYFSPFQVQFVAEMQKQFHRRIVRNSNCQKELNAMACPGGVALSHLVCEEDARRFVIVAEEIFHFASLRKVLYPLSCVGNDVHLEDLVVPSLDSRDPLSEIIGCCCADWQAEESRIIRRGRYLVALERSVEKEHQQVLNLKITAPQKKRKKPHKQFSV